MVFQFNLAITVVMGWMIFFKNLELYYFYKFIRSMEVFASGTVNS